MEFLSVILLIFLSISIQFNFLLFINLKKAKKSPTPTIEAQQVLAAFASGKALLKIDVVDPGDILIRSPRG